MKQGVGTSLHGRLLHNFISNRLLSLCILGFLTAFLSLITASDTFRLVVNVKGPRLS